MANERTGVIYLITNTVNGKQYVGQTVNFVKRWTTHQRESAGDSDLPLHRAVRKHGVDNFSFEIYQKDIPAEYLDDCEIAVIRHLGTFGKGYNATGGGDGTRGRVGELNPLFGKRGELCHNFGRTASEETRAKQSAAKKGKPSLNQGKPISDAQKIKQSVSMKGKLAGEKHPMFGKKHTPEAIEKISKARSSQIFSAETIAKRASKVRGRSHKDSSSDFSGVSFDKQRNKWKSKLKHWCKRFNTEVEAAHARDVKVIELGLTDKYPLNFPDLAVAA